MSHYVIGDVQGCYDELMLLCKKIKFNPKKDKLIFAGDLVNRGPKSFEVLNFCLENKKSIKMSQNIRDNKPNKPSSSGKRGTLKFTSEPSLLIQRTQLLCVSLKRMPSLKGLELCVPSGKLQNSDGFKSLSIRIKALVLSPLANNPFFEQRTLFR